MKADVPGKGVGPSAELDGLLDPLALATAERGNETDFVDLGADEERHV